MGFQILDKNGEALTIGSLDREVAEFWGKEVHPKNYATPGKVTEGMSLRERMSAEEGNWFDTIGYQIHSPGDYTSGWNNVKCTLWTMQVQGLYDKSKEELDVHIEVIKEYLKPYYDLINHWEAKGYTPLKLE